MLEPDTTTFTSEIWLYPGESASWHFVTLPKDLATQIKLESGPDQIRGMVKVEVSIGKTNWKTSIFWDKKAASYLLPLKAEVRKKEHIQLGDTLAVSLRLV